MSELSINMASTSVCEDPVKVEENNDLSQACRICLAWDIKLYSIHEYGLEDMYKNITGSTLSVWDGFPQHVCVFCRAALVKAHVLRARSRRADLLLRQALEHQHFITDSFIRSIDRSLYGLSNTFTIQSSHEIQNVTVYTCVHDDSKCNLKSQSCLDDKIHKTEAVDKIRDDDFKEVDLNYGIVNYDISNRLSPEEDDLKEDEQDDINDETTKHVSLNLEFSKVYSEPHSLVKKTRKKVVKQKNEKKVKEKLKATIKKRAKLKDEIKTEKKKKENDKVSVRERKPQSYTEKLGTEAEIREFEKKYNFQIQTLTEDEIAQDMEDRKKSDNYQNLMYRCEMCFKGYLTSVSYNNHLKTHAKARGDHVCRYCQLRYNSPGKLRDHISNAHRLKLLCTVCSKFVTGIQFAILHAAYHEGATFQCAHCDRRFLKKTSRSTHMRIAHPLENADIGTCELCGEIFTSRKGLKMHKTRSHRESLDKNLFCRKCRLQFESREALQHHKEQQPGQRCHNNQSSCQKCGELFLDEDELIQHKHAGHGLELFTCDACNKSFLSKVSLSVHIDRLHLSIKPSMGRQAYYTEYAATHKKRTADDAKEKKNVCEVCGKAFSCLALLKTHQMLHTGDRPFKCTECPKAYLNAWQLRNHVLDLWHLELDSTRQEGGGDTSDTALCESGMNHSDCVHKRIRKWRCSECPKTFLHQSSVYVHKLIHTGKRTHMCSFCGKSFLQSGSLYTHVKYVHMKEKPPPRKRSRKKADNI